MRMRADGRACRRGDRLPGRHPNRPMRRTLCAAMALALAPFGLAWSQSSAAPIEAQAQPAPAAQAPLPEGWVIIPGLSIGLGYDSNLFATPDDPDGDLYLALSPSLRMRRAGRWGDLTLDASATDTRYRHRDGEDSLDYRFDASGNAYVTSTAKFFGGLGMGRSHEDRTSPDDVFGVEPTRFDEANAHLGFSRRGPKWSARIGGTFQKMRFEDVLDADGHLINNQDRDRDVIGMGVRVGYALVPEADLFVQGTLDDRRYQWRLDDAGFNRESSGDSWMVGLATRGPGKVEGEVYVGQLSHRFDDPRFDDVREATVGASLRWRVTPATMVSASLDRVVYDTTIPGASSYLDTSLGLRVNRTFNDRLSARAGLVFARSEFNGIDRTDDVANPSVGLSYRITRQVQLDADYRLLQRRSDLASAEYDRHAFFVGLRLDPKGSPLAAPAGTTAPLAPLAIGDGPSGFYAGGALGQDVLATRVTGTRGEHGEYLGEFSGGGHSGALFAGYGWSFRRLYLAAELDLARSRADWLHDKTPDSRIFSAEAGRETGVTVFAGLVLPERALATLSAGRRRADFDSFYVTDDGLASDHDDRERATSYGLGLEAPLSAHLFARMRYEVSPYDGYDVVYEEPAADRFSGSQGRFQLGLGWRFGAAWAPSAAAPRVGGFYAGAQGGDDRSWSELDALMRQADAPTETEFEANFGGRGLDFGAFAGYGHAWGPVYLGIELEADASKSSWRHERLPEGRQYSVEARSSDGVALRLGYATRGGALLYVRGGAVRGRLRTLYEKGGNPDAWVDRDDTLSGTRFGVGLEAPLTTHTFLRLDYTSTVYDAIGFTTIHERADELRFRNRQHMARLGFGFRF